MRTLIAFPCHGETLFATLDAASGMTGLLIVSGGNEIRAGAHRGMAALAARLAARGIPVFRFDRRGVGDSDGPNAGYAGSAPDIAAAAAAFRAAAPHLTRLIGLGNCDAATALALFHADAGLDALVLANPWLGDEVALPPPAAIRARYAARLRNPREWRRLVTGRIDLGKLFKGLFGLAARSPRAPLATQMATGLNIPTTIVLASQDRTAQVFAAAWQSRFFAPARTAVTLVEIPTASHSFARTPDAGALEAVLVTALG